MASYNLSVHLKVGGDHHSSRAGLRFCSLESLWNRSGRLSLAIFLLSLRAFHYVSRLLFSGNSAYASTMCYDLDVVWNICQQRLKQSSLVSVNCHPVEVIELDVVMNADALDSRGFFFEIGDHLSKEAEPYTRSGKIRCGRSKNLKDSMHQVLLPRNNLSTAVRTWELIESKTVGRCDHSS
ncbi:hypothetical protein Tco_0014727 [Tanacetum coccineum]